HRALPMGIEAQESYGEATIQLNRGDLLLLYTDGITEAMAPAANGTRELFGVERLDKLLIECAAVDTNECLAKIRAAVATFAHDNPPTDDQTLLAIRC